jgi:hypothetical protein
MTEAMPKRGSLETWVRMLDVISTREVGFMIIRFILILCTTQQPAHSSRRNLIAGEMDGLMTFISNIDGSLAAVHCQGTYVRTVPCDKALLIIEFGWIINYYILDSTIIFDFTFMILFQVSRVLAIYA